MPTTRSSSQTAATVPATRSRASSAPPTTKAVKFSAPIADHYSALKATKCQNFPDIREPSDIPPPAAYRVDGRPPMYVLGWMISEEEWYNLVKPPFDIKGEDLGFTDVDAIQSGWNEVYSPKFGCIWAPQVWRFASTHTLVSAAANTYGDLRELANDETLVEKIIQAGADSMGFPTEKRLEAKWYQLTSLCNKRSTVWKELNIR